MASLVKGLDDYAGKFGEAGLPYFWGQMDGSAQGRGISCCARHYEDLLEL